MQRYNWTKIATLYETVPLFSLVFALTANYYSVYKISQYSFIVYDYIILQAAEDFDRQYTNIYGRNDDHLILSFSDSPAVALQQIHV